MARIFLSFMLLFWSILHAVRPAMVTKATPLGIDFGSRTSRVGFFCSQVASSKDCQRGLADITVLTTPTGVYLTSNARFVSSATEPKGWLAYFTALKRFAFFNDISEAYHRDSFQQRHTTVAGTVRPCKPVGGCRHFLEGFPRIPWTWICDPTPVWHLHGGKNCVSFEGRAASQYLQDADLPSLTFPVEFYVAVVLERLQGLALNCDGSVCLSNVTAVIALPAAISPVESESIKLAASIAELKDVSFVRESFAVVLDFINREHYLPPNAKLLVVDLGAEAISVTLMSYSIADDTVTLLAEVRDHRCGCDRLDELIMQHAAKKLDVSVSTLTRHTRYTLLSECARAKHALSDKSRRFAMISNPNKDAKMADFILESDWFYTVNGTEKFRADLAAALLRVLSKAGVSAQEITHIIPVGGCSEVPGIRDEIALFVGEGTEGSKAVVKLVPNSLEAVTRGATLFASRRAKFFPRAFSSLAVSTRFTSTLSYAVFVRVFGRTTECLKQDHAIPASCSFILHVPPLHGSISLEVVSSTDRHRPLHYNVVVSATANVRTFPMYVHVDANNWVSVGVRTQPGRSSNDTPAVVVNLEVERMTKFITGLRNAVNSKKESDN